jgi:hypothetical protein
VSRTPFCRDVADTDLAQSRSSGRRAHGPSSPCPC